MICISIAQESRRLALVDMLNAAGQCDLLSVRLDRFEKAPDLAELLAVKRKPVMLVCRRPQDGGHWRGTEAERLALLRQCVLKADYVEIELDVADEVRPFPPAKRVIAHTSLDGTPRDIAATYAEALTKKPDVIRLVTRADTPEEAWPLVQILAKPAVPTVVTCLGDSEVMLILLGKKMGAPWVYAALEKGLETYPGQPTIRDLQEIYHYQAVDRSTRFIGVTGRPERERASVAMLNAGLAHLQLPVRCLPLPVGSMALFRKIVEAVRLAAVVVDPEHRAAMLEMATDVDPTAKEAGAADVLLHGEDKWLAYFTFYRAARRVLEAALQAKYHTNEPFKGRVVMVVGVNATARRMAAAIQRRGAMPILASYEREAAHQLAQALQCRYVQFEALYSTTHDVLVVCDDEHMPLRSKGAPSGPALRASYLRPGMTVMDLTAVGNETPLLREARERGCNVASARQVAIEQAVLQLRLLTGQEVPSEVLREKMNAVAGEEE